MVYLLGQEYQHLHDTVAYHCLNIGTVEDFKIIRKLDSSDPLTVYAMAGGMEKPIFTASSLEKCTDIVSKIILKQVTNDPHSVINITECITPEEQTGGEVITEMLEVLRDVGRADLVRKFNDVITDTLTEIDAKYNGDQPESDQIEQSTELDPADLPTIDQPPTKQQYEEYDP